MSLALAFPLAGRADEPALLAPATAAVSSSANLTATDPSTSAPVEKTAAQVKRESVEAKIKLHGIDGYKPETTKAGQTVYCKTEASLGSHFETKQCRSLEQLRDQALQGKEFTEQMQHVVPQSKN